jgi:hypothetical protein
MVPLNCTSAADDVDQRAAGDGRADDAVAVAHHDLGIAADRLHRPFVDRGVIKVDLRAAA